MQAPWESVLTMSVVHCMAYPECITGSGPIADTLAELAADDFFAAAEVTWVKDPVERVRVREIASQSRLRLGYAAQPVLLLQGLNLNDLDPAGRQKAVGAVKASIDEAVEMGCERVSFLSGPDPGDADRERALDALADSVTAICRHARERGIPISLETFDRDLDKKCLLGPSELSAQFAARIREDFSEFGLLYDLSHLPLLNETPRFALTTLKDHLAHIHVGNCVKVAGRKAFGDQHPRFGFPGGENDVPELTEFLKVLFEIGYLKLPADGDKPWVGFEVKPQEGESPHLILVNTKRAWRQAWANLQLP